MDTIVVTGGAGFIGSHLVEALLPYYKVLVLDNRTAQYSSSNNLAQAENHQNYSLVDVDITDIGAVEEAIHGIKPKKIIHLAAATGVRRSIDKPGHYTRVNVDGTVHMLEIARKHNVEQFIFGSSSSVYGNNPKVSFSEDDPTDNPISPYAASKKSAELMCKTFSAMYALPVTCLRFFTVYGERGRPDMAIYKFASAISRGEPITVFGEGTRRDYTYVADIVEGILAALQNPYPYEVFNLGNSSPIDLPTLISTIEQAVGKQANINRQPMQRGDVNQTYADVSKAKKLLGWQPTTPIADGIARFARWLNG